MKREVREEETVFIASCPALCTVAQLSESGYIMDCASGLDPLANTIKLISLRLRSYFRVDYAATSRSEFNTREGIKD